ncbi:hypothetical protein UY3_15711 [Chelonia mydas]|uniref:Uncharacterized protein n=1 Tax=Chelonia mydas TaxID=8469 RepID=M7APL0_CHEMY|nr:hypothetical protein UY3_15711 [Chelonia mydas]
MKANELGQACHKAREPNNRSGAKQQTYCFDSELHALLGIDPTPTLQITTDTSEEPKTETAALNSKEVKKKEGDTTWECSHAMSQDLFKTPPQSSHPPVKHGMSLMNKHGLQHFQKPSQTGVSAAVKEFWLSFEGPTQQKKPISVYQLLHKPQSA